MDSVRDFWVRAAVIVSLLIPVYFAAAALGTRFGLFDWTFGFVGLAVLWGTKVLLGGAAFAFVGLLLAWFVQPRQGVAAALLALLIPVAGLGYGYYLRTQAQQNPIHDISTDLVDPPSFSGAVATARSRVTSGNDLDLLNKRLPDGRAYVEVQREIYPDIVSIPTGLDQARAFEIADTLAREQGWWVGTVNQPSGTIEATTRSLWFGFTDDIAIRVRADGSGARIDMRSTSRVGRSDLGANAARVRAYMTELRRRLEGAEGG
ncbi:MAG: DUF1499 domain-containing protein [Vitreimonas sp.]